MAMAPRTLRVPETAKARILGDMFTIQTNHCRTPGCANFGVPARTKRGKTGPSADRDLRYAVISTSKGQEPALRCKACNDKGAIRSNAAIAEEIERIAGYARPLENRFACNTGGCTNFGLSIGEHRHLYVKRAVEQRLRSGHGDSGKRGSPHARPPPRHQDRQAGGSPGPLQKAPGGHRGRSRLTLGWRRGFRLFRGSRLNTRSGPAVTHRQLSLRWLAESPENSPEARHCSD